MHRKMGSCYPKPIGEGVKQLRYGLYLLSDDMVSGVNPDIVVKAFYNVCIGSLSTLRPR